MGTNSGKERFVVGVAYSTNKSKLHVVGSFGEEYFSEDNLKNTSYTVNLKDLLPGKTYYYASYTKAGDTYKFGMVKSLIFIATLYLYLKRWHKGKKYS